MSENKKQFLVELGLGAAAMALAIAFERSNGVIDWVHLLSDGSFFAAALLLCTGGLRFCASKGVFDVMGYGIKSTFMMMLPGNNSYSTLRDRETLEEYRERKAQRRKTPKFSLLAGLIYLAFSLIFLPIY